MTTFSIGKTNDGHALRVDLAALIGTRAVITASSGSGKSWLLRLIAERTAGKVQTIILDPEGEFGTLRERFDYLLVGEGGETAADVRSAKLLARKLAQLGVSAVIDLFDMKTRDPWHGRRQFVAAFLEALVNIPKDLRRPILVMIDEAHQFAPEGTGKRSKDDPIQESRLGVANLMALGRKRGLCGLLATQRISKLDKDAMGEAKNVFIGGMTLDLDQDRAGDMLGFAKADKLTLRDLEPGEFFCYGPAVEGKGVHRFKSGEVATTHASVNERHNLGVTPAPDSIKKIVAALGDLPAEVQAEKDELTTLRDRVNVERSRNVDLQKELRARPTVAAPVETIVEVKVPVLNGELPRLEAALDQLDLVLKPIRDLPAALGEAMGPVNTTLGDVRVAVQRAIQAPARPAASVRPVTAPKPARAVEIPTRVARPVAITATAAPSLLLRPQQRILDALAFLESVRVPAADKVQLALFADISPRSSDYGKHLAALRDTGLIDYPSAGEVGITDAGRELARQPATEPTAAGVQDALLRRLPDPQARVLRVLIDRYPEPVEKIELARLSEISPTSSDYGKHLAALNKLKVAAYPTPGYVVALPVLFLEG